MVNASGVHADTSAYDADPFGDGQPPRVLLVDDNRTLRRQLHELLADYGIEVVGEAADGREGLALSERLHPDIVLMDYRMPGSLNGIVTTRLIIDRLPSTRVVLLSVYDDPVLAQEARQAGATAYIVKGSPTVDLVDTLARAWDGHASA